MADIIMPVTKLSDCTELHQAISQPDSKQFKLVLFHPESDPDGKAFQAHTIFIDLAKLNRLVIEPKDIDFFFIED